MEGPTGAPYVSTYQRRPTDMDAILADLAQRYPEGFVSFTRGGRRTDSANIYRARGSGYSVNVNGQWHAYTHDGRLSHIGRLPAGMGPIVPRQARKAKHSGGNRPRMRPLDHAFIDRKMREIGGTR